MIGQENQPRPSLMNHQWPPEAQNWATLLVHDIRAQFSFNSQPQMSHFIFLWLISHTRFRKAQHLALTDNWTTVFRGSLFLFFFFWHVFFYDPVPPLLKVRKGCLQIKKPLQALCSTWVFRSCSVLSWELQVSNLSKAHWDLWLKQILSV